MSFWRAHMPERMYLRSACDWHLDAQDEETIEAFLRTQDRMPADVEPLSLEFRTSNTSNWFQARQGDRSVAGHRGAASIRQGTATRAFTHR